MDNPAQQNDPEQCSHDELDERHEQAPLDKLTKPGDKETAQRSDNISGGSLLKHVK